MNDALPTGLLALPAEDDRALASLRRKLQLLALHTLLSFDARRAGPWAARTQRVQQFLQAVLRGPDRKRIPKAFGGVDVLAPVLGLASGAVAPERALALAVPALMVALSYEHQPDSALLWDVPLSRLHDPRRGLSWQLTPDGQGVLWDASGLTLRTADGSLCPLDGVEHPQVRISEPFVALAGGPVLALVDDNPLALLEEHPEKSGNALSLGDRSSDEWRASLDQALELIRSALPRLHAELVQSLERIVPVGYEPERHLSASYREVPGLIYLTLHPSVLTLAEAIVHETQHGKLNTLRWFDPVLENGDSTWSRSAVRPDLRPLSGVLLAVHAFVPVAALHARLAAAGHPLAKSPHFLRRRAEVLAANRHGLATLRELGQPTAAGRRVLDALEALQAAVDSSELPTSEATVAALG